MTVVAHHPVVVHLEGIALGLLAVDEDAAAVVDAQVVVFIHLDAALIDGQILQGQLDARALLGNPHGTIVVAGPSGVGVLRIEFEGRGVVVEHHGVYQILALTQRLDGTGRERHISVLVERQQVFHRDTQLLQHLVGDFLARLQGYRIGILHIVGLLVGLAVEIDDMVLDLEGLSGQSHTALHIVLTTVGRTAADVAKIRGHAGQIVAAQPVDFTIVAALLHRVHAAHIGRSTVLLLIEVGAEAVDHRVVLGGIALFGEDAVAGRIVEHHNVIKLHMAQALHAAIVPVGPGDVAVGIDYGQRVLGERHGERGLRDAGAIAHLAHKEIVAREQTLLKRRRGDDIVLEEEEVDEVDSHQCKHEGVDPTHHKPHRSLGIAPPLPAYLLGDIHIKDEGHNHQAEPRFHPYEKEKIQCQYNQKLGPLHFHIEFGFCLVYHSRLEFEEV